MPKADNGTKDARPRPHRHVLAWAFTHFGSHFTRSCGSSSSRVHTCSWPGGGWEKAAVIQLNALSHTGRRLHCATDIGGSRAAAGRRQDGRALLRLLGSSHNCESRLHIWLHCLSLSLATTFVCCATTHIALPEAWAWAWHKSTAALAGAKKATRFALICLPICRLAICFGPQ